MRRMNKRSMKCSMMRSIHSKLPKNQIPCHVDLKADLDVDEDSKNEDTNTFANEENIGPDSEKIQELMGVSCIGVESMGVASTSAASKGMVSMSEKLEVQGVHPFQIKAIKTRAEALEMWLVSNGAEKRKDNDPTGTSSSADPES